MTLLVFRCSCGDLTTGIESRVCLRCGDVPRVARLRSAWWLACAWVLRARRWVARRIEP